MLVTVAIPVRNGGPLLAEVLAAVRAQMLPAGVSAEVLVCDSGSTDGSPAAARAAGAEVIAIEPAAFGHGATRNLLMERSRGEVVAFLTQDAVPANPAWLARLLEAFALVERVGLAFGPYLPRADASPMVRRELDVWFRSLSPDGAPRVDRLGAAEAAPAPRALYGPRGYFTDANGCVLRAAWERVPFRRVAYAEDHALAIDMLTAGYAKVFVPEAAVVHSHDYSPWQWVRRSFDEARAVQAIYELDDLGDPRRLARGIRGAVAADVRSAGRPPGADLRSAGGPPAAGSDVARSAAALLRSLGHHLPRAIGTALGARADSLPAGLVRRLSLERRG